MDIGAKYRYSKSPWWKHCNYHALLKALQVRAWTNQTDVNCSGGRGGVEGEGVRACMHWPLAMLPYTSQEAAGVARLPSPAPLPSGNHQQQLVGKTLNPFPCSPLTRQQHAIGPQLLQEKSPHTPSPVASWLGSPHSSSNTVVCCCLAGGIAGNGCGLRVHTALPLPRPPRARQWHAMKWVLLWGERPWTLSPHNNPGWAATSTSPWGLQGKGAWALWPCSLPPARPQCAARPGELWRERLPPFLLPLGWLWFTAGQREEAGLASETVPNSGQWHRRGQAGPALGQGKWIFPGARAQPCTMPPGMVATMLCVNPQWGLAWMFDKAL